MEIIQCDTHGAGPRKYLMCAECGAVYEIVEREDGYDLKLRKPKPASKLSVGLCCAGCGTRLMPGEGEEQTDDFSGRVVCVRCAEALINQAQAS